jgi:hypothetical protein
MIALRTLVVVALILPFSPAHASADFPMPPEPRWWGQTGLVDVRYGQWLPCNTGWNITNDCVQGIRIFKLDGTPAGELSYKPLEGFNPETSTQVWQMASDPQGNSLENSAYFIDLNGSPSTWTLPTGLTNSDGTTDVNAYVHLMQSSLQINLSAYDMVKASLPEGYYFEFDLKSMNFSKKIKWVLSNVSDPQLKIVGDVITVRGLPDKSPAARAGDAVCEPNELKAFSSQRNMAVNMIYFEPGNKTEATDPNDVILGTNGWWCLSDFRFDRESQQIVVKAGNVHYDEFGVEIQGWMELKIKGDRARKWWGMDPAIASQYAKVEITYQNGTSKVATVTSRYDAKNDWINLRAYGFTYSTPQLAVSFKKPVVAPIKKTITCIKGKTVKKVTAVAPKCPSGYKKR